MSNTASGPDADSNANAPSDAGRGASVVDGDRRTDAGGSSSEVADGGSSVDPSACGADSDFRALPTLGADIKWIAGGTIYPRSDARAWNGRLLVLYYFGAAPKSVTDPPRALYVYEPKPDAWRIVEQAEHPPADLTNPTLAGWLGDRYLVTGTDASGRARWGSFEPLTGSWLVFDSSNSPTFLRNVSSSTSDSSALSLLIGDGKGGFERASAQGPDSTSAMFERQYNQPIVVRDSLFAWGGRTADCEEAPNCKPAGYSNGNQALPYMTQRLHADGFLQFGDGSTKPIGTSGAPSARYGALTAVIGDEVFVWGGEANPHWGPGSGPANAYALSDGAIYSPNTDSWRSVAHPDGLLLQSGESAGTERGTARISGFSDLFGKHALVSLNGVDANGRLVSQRLLYDVAQNRWRLLDVPDDVSALPTRSGKLLLVRPRYAGATLLDLDSGATREISLTPPGLLSDTSLVGPVVSAWDGCRLFVYGYAQVATEPNTQGQCPQGFGCDPPSPVYHVTQVPGGATFNIGD